MHDNNTDWGKILERFSKLQRENEQMTPQQKMQSSKHFEQKFRKYLARKANANILCMADNCQEMAVNSHTISKNQYLAKIADDEHVIGMKPKDSIDGTNISRRLFLSRISINDATTFKGYCKQHDNCLFESIDNGPLQYDTDVFLQCLRCIDYSLYNQQWSLEYQRCRLQSMSEAAQISKESFQKLYPGTIDTLKPIQILRSFIMDSLDDLRENPPCPLNLQLDWMRYIVGDSGYMVFFRRVPMPIPLAMYNYFILSSGHILYIITLPGSDYTDVILIDNQKCGFLCRWIGPTAHDNLTMLNFLETCMILFEQWVIRPKVYESMPEDKRALLEADIYNGHCPEQMRDFFWHHKTYDVSIFDDVRRELLASLHKNDARRKWEEEKISELPHREAKASAEKIMNAWAQAERRFYWEIK